jgi:Protein of unknown function (DUF1439)
MIPMLKLLFSVKAMYKKIWLLAAYYICLSFFMLSCSAIVPKEIHITKEVLQEKLSQKFPQHKNILSLYQISVSNPIINLDAKQNRVQVIADTVIHSALFENIDGKITLSSQIDLDADKRQLILVQPMIDDLNLKTSNQTNKILLPILRAGVAQALDAYAIYTIKPEDLTFLGTKIQPSAVVVTDKGIDIKIEKQ